MRRMLWLLAMMSLVAVWPIESATRISLHSTLEEVAIWNTRRQSGPYLDDWTRILGRANACVSNCSSSTWLGNQLNSAWVSTSGTQLSPNAYPGRTKGEAVRDAGFVYMVYINSGNVTLITQAASYLTAARDTLLAQAAITGTDFSNTTKWPASTYDTDGFAQAGQVDYEIVNWLRRLIYAYSYIRPGLTGGQQSTLDTWFNNAGTFWSQVMYNVLAFRMPNHATDNFTCSGSPCPSVSRGLTHFGGDTFYAFHDGVNNIFATHAALTGAIGAVTGNTTLMDRAKHWFKVWMMFAVNSNGVVGDQHRWNGSTPGTAFLYAGTVLGSMITLADHLARAGDIELMTYSTSGGAFGWEGGTKNLLTAMNHYANLVIKERNLSPGPGVANYASTTSTTDPTLLIGPGSNRAEDIYLIPANLYHKSSLVTQAYTRTPFPTSPTSSGDDKWGGDWGTYPAIRFMFGQNEQVVDPYNLSASCPASSVCLSAGNSDAEELISTDAVTLGGNNLDMDSTQLIGLHYVNLPIPKNATCDSATIQFTASSTGFSSGSPTYSIKAQNSFAAAAFTTTIADLSSRTLGAASVSWSPSAWTANTANAATTTPNLCTLLQGFIDNASWSETDNEVAFIISVTSGGGFRGAKTKDSGALTPLTVAYTPAGTSTLTQTNYRFSLVDVSHNTRYLRATNAGVTVAPGSCARLYIQVEGEGAGLSAQVFKPQYAIDDTGGDGPWLDVGTNPTENLYLGVDGRYANQTPTTTTLTLGGDTFVPGSFMTGPGLNFPSITFADDTRTEWVLSLCVKSDVVANTTFDVCMAQQDNTLVTCTQKPRLTVGTAVSGFEQ